VSAILSDPAPDSTMAFPDYQQSCTDHARLLVLITRIGHQISDDSFKRISACIDQIRDVPVRDKTGLNRIIRVRYTPQYHVENNDWGEFQAHRRLVGVISVGSCASQVELNELCRLHESAKNKYSATLFDTRCVVMCEGTENGIGNEDENNSSPVNGGDLIEDHAAAVKADLKMEADGGVDKPPSWFQPQNHKTRLLQFHGSKYAAGLRNDIQEFIASLFWVLESKRVDWSREGGDKTNLLCAPFERKDFVGLDMESRNNRKRILGRHKKHLGDLSLLAGLPAEAWNYYQSGMDILRPANDWLWLAGCQEGLCAVSMLLQEGQESGTSMGSVGLSQEDIIEKYRDCVNHYAKYKNAGIIETEASLKAVKYLVKNRSFLLASEFLQNIVFINLQLSDREKIERFISLSDLYSKIGFKRKAAFFQRVAAMRCVAPGNPQHDWQACYSLMLKAVLGYDLDLTSELAPDTGWPTLQVQLLQELVGTSRKMGAHSASTRHMTYLFQNMFASLSSTEKQDFATQLSVLAQRAPANTSPLQLDNILKGSKTGINCDLELPIILPPINISVLPQVKKMTALPLAPHLTPSPAPTKDIPHTGPFLFTPIQNFGAGSARSSGRAKPKRIVWVQGCPGEVCLEVENSLGVEVKVSSMSLAWSGADLETESSLVMLDTHNHTQTIILKAIPRSLGNVEILGYSHSVLGVSSTCLLKDFSDQESIKVEVIADLPLIELTIQQPVINSSESSPTPPGESNLQQPNCDKYNAAPNTQSAAATSWHQIESLSLYGGERRELRLAVKNTGTEPATSIELTCQVSDGEEGPLLEFDPTSIKHYLPLKPGDSCSIPLQIIGINNQNLRLDDGLSTTGSDSRWSASAGYPSLQSRISTSHSLPTTATPSNMAAHGHHQSANHPPMSYSSQSNYPPTLGGEQPSSLTSNYSAGSGGHPADCVTSTVRLRAGVKGGQTEGWCRWATTSLPVTQLPSIGVSRWDVLAGDRQDNCFLVLDLVNRTQNEVELTYSARKQLLIEPGDTCRVPVPVEKCSFSESLEWEEGCDEVIQYIQDRVHITWKFSEGNVRGGEVSVSGVYWSECMLEMVRRPPLVTKVFINSREYNEGEDTEGKVGETVEVKVNLENNLLEPVSDCRLLLKLDQDPLGIGGVGCTGSGGLSIPGSLCPGEVANHVHTFLPLAPGQYSIFVSISLRFRQKIYSWRLPNVNLDILL